MYNNINYYKQIFYKRFLSNFKLFSNSTVATNCTKCFKLVTSTVRGQQIKQVTNKCSGPETLNFSIYGVQQKVIVDNASRSIFYWLKHNYSNSVRCYSTRINTSRSAALNRIKEESAKDSDNKNRDGVFLNPKNILHNCFDELSRDLKQKSLRLTPSYSVVKNDKKSSSWKCTYNLKWPEAIKFSTVASTKQEASYNAANIALKWLLENNKITGRGHAILYDKDDIQKMKSQIYPMLKVDDSLCALMDEVVSDESIKTFFANFDKENKDSDVQVIKEELPVRFSSPSHLDRDLDFYLANESPKLPISKYKNVLIDMLKNNNVLIVKGETGCGKSTRAPQFVLEAWAKEMHVDSCINPCKIVVTEPRRIAAISLAERVAEERKENVGETVGYHVRLQSNFDKTTGRILYCTTGILLRHIQCDPSLQDITHVIVDEAHERDVNIDLLLNLLRHALKLNPKLKVIIMSATIDAEEFKKYFDNAPILNIPGFTYPVEQHYLTDKREYFKTYNMCKTQYPSVVHEDVVSCINYIHKNKSEGAVLCFLPGWDDIVKVRELIPMKNDLSVLCLHSRLDVNDQRKIFHNPPPGVRKIILTTNIAETSVTINDVVYVIDTGIHKEQRWDIEKGIMCIDNHWISKASSVQRKGRAGRCQPGECFHLYPKSKYEEFAEYSVPEILRTSLTKIVLDSKVYSNNMNAVEFLKQLICSPDDAAIGKAVDELKELEMLDDNETLTPLGRAVSNFQIHPKLSKAMVNAIIFRCVTPIVDIVTLYSMDSALFSKALVDKDAIKRNLENFSKTSDHLAMMNLFEKWLYYVSAKEFLKADEFCHDHGIVKSKLRTLRKLRHIHFDYLYKGLHHVLPISDDFSDNQELVKGVLLSGVRNVLQRRTWDFVKGRYKNANVLVTRQNQKATVTSDSLNSKKGSNLNFLLYINETISNLRRTILVRETSSVSPITVLLFTNSKLVIEDIKEANNLTDCTSDDQVLIKLEGTKIGFLCNRRVASSIQQYKEVLDNFRQYYIHQLTTGNDYNSSANKYWQDTLRTLNEVLNRLSVN